VPPVLLSGHHASIDAWRERQALIATYRKRELLDPPNWRARASCWPVSQARRPPGVRL
jgi:tRNA G37 N-methylase TrmD